MIAAFTILTVLVISLIVVRLATAALTLTGSQHGHSAVRGAERVDGDECTTAESERIVDHHARRRIVLMVLSATRLITEAEPAAIAV